MTLLAAKAKLFVFLLALVVLSVAAAALRGLLLFRLDGHVEEVFFVGGGDVGALTLC